jgi:hypothetical protein
MSCLCFFHAAYAPVEIIHSAVTWLCRRSEESLPDRHIRLLAFDIFHPPRNQLSIAP